MTGWVGRRLGVQVTTTGSPVGVQAGSLVDLAVRRNPRRAHLLVSRVLGKHIPTAPGLVIGSGRLLGLLVGAALDGVPAPAQLQLAGDLLEAALRVPHTEPVVDRATAAFQTALTAAAFQAALTAAAQAPGTAPDGGTGSGGTPPLVVGFAETAVALGDAVAQTLPGSVYLQSTRRVTDVPAVGGFEEAHSHASDHLLCPHDQELLRGDRARHTALVLVDDELSTGRTAVNTIEALHRLCPRPQYVVACLLDARPESSREIEDLAERIGVAVEVVSLARAGVLLPADLPRATAALLAELPAPAGAAKQPPLPRGAGRWVQAPTAPGPLGGRHAITGDQRVDLHRWLTPIAAPLAPAAGERVLVLGTEEFMAAPLMLAEGWAGGQPGATVRFSTTTRSPALPVDDPGYPLRTALHFAAIERLPVGDHPDRYAYNVAPGHGEPGWDRIVLVTDDRADGSLLDRDALQAGLLPALRRVSAHVDVLTVPEPSPCAPTGTHR